MVILNMVVVGIVLSLIAICAGLYWTRLWDIKSKVSKWSLAYCCGLVTLWGIFQIVAVPFILADRYLSELIWVYLTLVFVWCLISIISDGKRKTKLSLWQPNYKCKKEEKIYWYIFGVILCIQTILMVLLPFADGDDAYYTAVAKIAEQSNKMYQSLVYTGGTSELDIRHAIAPFPIWIATIARITKIEVTTVSNIVLPVNLLLFYYGIMGWLSKTVLKDRKYVPLLLIFIQLLSIWGNYSIYSAETFLLTRINQGKAVMASMMIPFIIFILYKFSEQYRQQKRVLVSEWVLLVMCVLTACLCTSLGTVLAGLLIGVLGVCLVVVYRKISILIGIVCSLIPAGCYILIYLWAQ